MKQLKDLKLKEISKLNSLSKEELKKEIALSMKNLFVLRMKKDLGELKQTHLIKALRRYVAQINTVATSKKLI